MPLALVKKLKWDTFCKTIDNGNAYACTLHKFQLKMNRVSDLSLGK